MRDALRWIVIGGLFLLPFVPLIVTGSLFFSYITGKNFVFRIIVEVVFAAWVLLALADARYRPRFSWILAAFVAFVVVIFLADVSGASPAKSLWSNYERMEGWVTLLHLLLYFIVAGSVLSVEKFWDRFLNTVLIGATLVSLYALLQLAGIVGIAQGGVRIDATLGNAIYMAGYMLFCAYIALIMLARTERVWMRALYGAAAFLFAFLLFASATRGAIIGLVGGLFVAALYAAFAARDNRAVRIAALSGITALVIAIGLFSAVRDAAFVRESPILGRIASISLAEGQTRFTIWGIAWEGVKERPLLGWGQSNFDFVFDKYYEPSLYGQEPWFDRVHNIFLDWLIAGGALGLGAYLALWVAVFYALLAPRGGSAAAGRLPLAERSILLGILVGYGFHNVFVFDNLVSYFLFATMLAYIHTRTAREMPRLSGRCISERLIARLIAPSVGIALIFSVYFVNIRNLSAAGDIIDAMTAITLAQGSPTMPAERYNTLVARSLAEFTQALARNSFAAQEIREQLALNAERVSVDEHVSPEVKRMYLARAEAELQTQIAERPGQARTHAFLGRLYRFIGETDRALAQLTLAVALAPRRQHLLFDVGSTYIDRKEYAQAQAVFKEAFDLAPAYEIARAYYLAAAIYTGDDALVAHLSAPPYDMLAVTNDLVLKAYYETRQYAKALAILDSRIQTNPNNFEARVLQAAVQHESGNTAAAVATLEAVARDFPQFKAQAERFIAKIQH